MWQDLNVWDTVYVVAFKRQGTTLVSQITDDKVSLFDVTQTYPILSNSL